MERVQFTTVVWGTWHVDAFLSFAIPSLLAPNNLPAFVNRHHSLYHIVTSESDADRFRESEVFSSLQSAMPVRLVVLEAEAFVGDTLDSHIRNQQQRSQEAIAAARVDDALPILIPPDVCWGDGSFAKLSELIGPFEAVVYTKYARVVDETVRSAIVAKCAGRERGTIRLTHCEIADLAVQHLHPLYSMYLPDSENWPHHAELSVWPVPREGFQMRILATDGFVLDQRAEYHHGLNSQETSPTARVFFPDADEISGLSLTPLCKDVDWYFTKQAADTLSTGLWWQVFHLSHAEFISAKHVNFAACEPSERLWRAAERRSDRWVSRARASLRLVHIHRKLGENPVCSRAALLASAAVRCPILYRLAADEARMTIFVPTNAVWEGLPTWFWDSLMDYRDSSDLVHLIRRHVVHGFAPVDVELMELKILDTMTTASGDQICVVDRAFPFLHDDRLGAVSRQGLVGEPDV